MAATTEEDQDEVVGTTPDALREQARARVKKRRDLKTHAVVYTLVNLAIWGIWVVVAANSNSWWPWPVFVTVFWGIGLAMNAWDVYFRKPGICRNRHIPGYVAPGTMLRSLADCRGQRKSGCRRST